MIMTHRCWTIYEIVRYIAQQLISVGAKASAVSLAICCKSIETAALDEVWQSLSSIAPLIKCFPPEIWTDVGFLQFIRAPLVEEWDHFQHRYASKVRHLSVSFSESKISVSALQVLHLYSHFGPVLPNLMSLNWQADNTVLHFISPFISRSLTTIVVTQFATASTFATSILTLLPILAPSIRDITVECLDHNHAMQAAASQLLMRCNPDLLREYNVDSFLSTAALRHAITLPYLESFWLVIESESQLPDPLPPAIFPSLRELVVEYMGEPTWLRLLPAIESKCLLAISVDCSKSDVSQFMESFQHTMTGCKMHERLQELEVTAEDDFDLTSDFIAFSFPFKNLTTLDINHRCTSPCQIDLVDEDIDLLTVAMPLLENLSIGASPCRGPSAITFKSLYNVSRRCIRLKKFQTHFDSAPFVAQFELAPELGGFEPGSFDPKIPLCSVKEINVGKLEMPSQPDASYIIGLGLMRVFPMLETLLYESHRWKNVAQLIRIFRHVKLESVVAETQ